jgi:hypothetical protein
MKKIIIMLLPLFLCACASITGSKHQPVSVDTYYKGKQVSDAQCRLLNNKGTWFVNTPGSVMIQKSYGDLAVNCQKDKYPSGSMNLESSSNGGVWGNILAGGIIGYAVDASSGAGFDYPTMINVELGQSVSLAPQQPAPQESSSLSSSKKKSSQYDNLN